MPRVQRTAAAGNSYNRMMSPYQQSIRTTSRVFEQKGNSFCAYVNKHETQYATPVVSETNSAA